MLQLEKICRQCRKPFVTRLRNQIYCSRACSDAAHRGVNFAKRKKSPPVIVRIRITERIPVWPEFEVKLGEVYEAERRQSCRDGHIMYLVDRPGGKTVIRSTECVEVSI